MGSNSQCSISGPPIPGGSGQTTLSCNCFPNSLALGAGAAPRTVRSARPLPASRRRRLRREAAILALERRPPPTVRNGAWATYSRSIGKRTLRSAASASRARMSPSARPAMIPTGITMKGFGNAGSTGGDALSRTVISGCQLALQFRLFGRSFQGVELLDPEIQPRAAIGPAGRAGPELRSGPSARPPARTRAPRSGSKSLRYDLSDARAFSRSRPQSRGEAWPYSPLGPASWGS